MHEPIKIDRKLPPHELNARRARKRLTQVPAHIAKPKHASKPKPESKSKLDPDHDGDNDSKACKSCSCKSHCKGCTCKSC